jgi:DNA invertase Pin-like site-specific DNA recombinase
MAGLIARRARRQIVPRSAGLNRLSRSLRDVLTIVERLAETKVGFRNLTEALDTTALAGRMIVQMVGVFSEFERAMLREGTKARSDTACQKGRIGGRRPNLSPQQQAKMRRMVSKGGKTATDAARLFKIHPAMVSQLLVRETCSITAHAKYCRKNYAE